MSEHSIKILHDWKNVRDTVVELDDLGNIANRVTTIEVDIRPGGNPAKVKLGLHLPQVHYQGAADVHLVVTAEQHRLLTQLGWTPPDTELPE